MIPQQPCYPVAFDYCKKYLKEYLKGPEQKVEKGVAKDTLCV